MQVLAPYDAEDARGLLKAAIRDPDPVIFLENEILYGESFPVNDKILDKEFTVPIGKVKVSMLPALLRHISSVKSSFVMCTLSRDFSSLPVWLDNSSSSIYLHLSWLLI